MISQHVPKMVFMVAIGKISSERWVCKSMNIKAAFLQVEIFHRQADLSPHSKTNVPQVFLWKMSNCGYRFSNVLCIVFNGQKGTSKV